MTKRDTRPDPLGTLPMFDTATTAEGRVLAAGRFRCGLCSTMGVDHAGDLCAVCAEHALTAKTPRDPGKATARKPTGRKATARKPRKAAVRNAG